MLIGKRLKELRKAKGLNQQELGNLVNVTKVSICCYEKGTRTPNLDTFQDLLNVFNVSADYLLGIDVKAEVADENEQSETMLISREEADFLCELRLNPNLHRKVVAEDSKRIVELLDKLLK